jgi:hypothetical protein
VSAYDRAASLLVALLVMVGVCVLMLFIMWLTNRVWVSQEDVPVEFIEPLPAGGTMGEGRDLEEPGEEEIEELLEPQLEETLDAVTDAISTQRATLEALEGEARSSTRGSGGGGSPGSGGGTADIVPRWDRWDILFSTTTLAAYAQQLDFFGIELAAVGGGSPNIEYAYNFSKRRPDRRTGKAADEDRIYMTWRRGPLKAADRTLLQRAGIDTSGKIMVQFYPPQTENLLAKVEHDHAPEVPVLQIRKTVFGVKPQGDEFVFYVLEQRKRTGR